MVILYTNNCPKCRVLKEKLDSKNIQYEIFDDVEEMIKRGFSHMPMLEVDGNVMDFKKAIIWVEKYKREDI